MCIPSKNNCYNCYLLSAPENVELLVNLTTYISTCYNIFKTTAPAMPKPSSGTDIIKIMLSQASKEMKTGLVPMAIPAFASRLKGVKGKFSDNSFYEMCGQMEHLIGPSDIGKAQLTHLVEAIM